VAHEKSVLTWMANNLVAREARRHIKPDKDAL
jgi:hypothetical protein